MDSKVFVSCFCLVFVTVGAIEMNLTNEWKQDIGWEIYCSWKIPFGDSLQSVRLYQNNQQFLIFRPETDGDNRVLVYRRLEDVLTTNCAISKEERQMGTCVLTSELYQPQRHGFAITCEVSGERPYFRMENKTIFIDKYVPPTDATLRVVSQNKDTGRVTLNCTSSGVPGPNLTWTIHGLQNIPHDFTGGAWNATSKLWDVWSALSYTSSAETTAVCTPEVSTAGKLVKGKSAQHNSAENFKGLITLVISTLLSLALIR
ncbi:unnamed protein product [Spodoptera exigua]|uniref:Ig-like domain-containing protein n=1 Tax=Spodoptera exigua TaxID=7107 RepID=A0A922M746_SPOEX|nr:hypothetical protein HF086_006639 [Spodoptera exigua]CAH0686094.1 unnamed protein product [Spodoptera exigua]